MENKGLRALGLMNPEADLQRETKEQMRRRTRLSVLVWWGGVGGGGGVGVLGFGWLGDI